MTRLKSQLISLLVLLPILCSAETIRLKLLDGVKISKIELKINRGFYARKSFVNGQQSKLDTSRIGGGLAIQSQNAGLWSAEQNKTEFTKVYSFKGLDYINHLELTINDSKTISTDDDLEIYLNKDGFQIINVIDLDHYVAGVVEAEAGYNLPEEYYKVQAVLCRTYALKNLDRHKEKGYDLCDKIHCQVFKNKCKRQVIIRATASTSGLVAVDQNLGLINTTFHSNCGGQTCNSEDVWVSSSDYLKSVKDTFCLNGPHSRWEKSFSKEKIKEYFEQKGIVDTNELNVIFAFSQDSIRFKEKNLVSLKLTTMRRELKLNSTLFSIVGKGDSVVFKGRGFGHGVGLCQEGGIAMSKEGYGYQDILKYYYKNINVVNLRSLDFFKD